MQTSNLWHVPTTGCCSHFPSKRKVPTPNQNTISKLDKNPWKFLFFLCIFGKFYLVSSATEAKPWRSAAVCISLTLSPIFPVLWHSRTLHCSQNWARGTPSTAWTVGKHQVLLRGTTDLRWCHQHSCLNAGGWRDLPEPVSGAAPTKAEHPEAHCRNAGEPLGVSGSLCWPPPDKPCRKGQPHRCVSSFAKPARAILHHYSVCQVQGGGDSSSRAEQHPEAER